MNFFTISKADIKHVSDIYGLSRTYAYASDSAEDSEDGFLVSVFTRENYIDFIESLEHFYVALDNERVVGFIFAYHCDEIEDAELKNRLTASSSRNCILVKQVCVEPCMKGRGVGRKLYAHLCWRVSGLDLFAAIVVEPKNLGSIKFHEKLGFSKVFDFTPADGIKRGMWKMSDKQGVVDRNKAISAEKNRDLLIKQLAIAVDLYKHEDSLNWSKVRHLLYITGGLGALLSFVAKSQIDNIVFQVNSVRLVALFGVTTSIGFFVALLFGVIYMQNRKLEVLNIDRLLVEDGGVSIFSAKERTETRWFSYMRSSPTRWVLVAFPVIITCFWGAVLAAALRA